MKRITALLLIIVICLCGCDKKPQEIKITGDDTSVVSRLENIVELQKSLFRAKVTKAETKNAIISKYNLDISTYTVYTVEILESYDGYTPTGTATVYWAGTDTEFVSRVNLIEKETYILDAEPWVYGEEMVYILYPGTASYPKVDSTDGITIAVSDTEALNVGTLESYREEYKGAVDAVNARIDGFSDTGSAAQRYVDIFKEVLDKNSNRAIYTERKYEWVPDNDFIDKTVARSQAVYNEALALVGDGVTAEQITELLK